MSRYDAPCRAVVIALGTDESIDDSRKVRIPFTSYGAERHARRWLARGYKQVSVAIYSRSTGRAVEVLTLIA